MASDNDPPSNDQPLPEEALAEWRAHEPTTQEVQALTERFLSSINGDPGAAERPAKSSRPGTTPPGGRLALGVTTALLGAGLGWWATRAPEAPTPTPIVAPADAATVDAGPLRHNDASTPVAAPDATHAARPATRRRRASRPAQKKRRLATSIPSPDAGPRADAAAPQSKAWARELNLISRIQRTFNATHNATVTLSLTALHAREFPQGQFWEQREAYAIRALVALKRGKQARARALEYFKNARPPRYRAQVEEALGSLKKK